MSDLNDFSKGLDEAAERRREKHRKFNDELGEPTVFVPSEDDPRFGTGFWKGEGGVFSYRRYANGFDPYSRTEYSDEFIKFLNDVRGAK